MKGNKVLLIILIAFAEITLGQEQLSVLSRAEFFFRIYDQVGANYKITAETINNEPTFDYYFRITSNYDYAEESTYVEASIAPSDFGFDHVFDTDAGSDHEVLAYGNYKISLYRNDVLQEYFYLNLRHYRYGIRDIFFNVSANNYGITNITYGFSQGDIIGFIENGTQLEYWEILSENQNLSNFFCANETISSDLTIPVNENYDNIQGSLTVNSGVTLTIQNGAQLSFGNGYSLIVNGTLNANNAYFTRIGSSGTWGGIQFNSGSSGNVQYCNINNASIGILCNGSSPTIQQNNLNNISTIGIFLYNASPSLLRNTIQGNSSSYGYNGIRCEEYSSPYIAKNTIRYFSTGINIYRYSSPNFSENASSEGHNKIVRTSSAIYGWYYSSPRVGQNGYPWGYNYIDSSSTYNAEAAWYTNILAENNWWGVVPLDANKFNAVSNSSIDYYPYLTSPPSLSIRESDPYTSTAMPIAFKIASGATSTTSNDLSSYSLFDDEDIKKALQFEIEQEYQLAFDIYEKVFKKGLSTAKGRYALVRLGDCFFKLNRNGIDKYLTSISESYKSLKKDDISAIALDLINRELLINREYEKVADNMKKIKNEFRINSEIEKSALYGLISLYVNCLGDIKSASYYYEELKQKFPKDKLLTDCEILLGNQYDASLNEKMVNDNESTKHEEFVLTTSNYPNPFNPTTTITYTLPDAGKVSVKIIDILGREVATLFDGYNTSGKHSVIWNARDVASGIYFYSINFNNQKLFKKILLMK